jgi:hypothetical protein
LARPTSGFLARIASAGSMLVSVRAAASLRAAIGGFAGFCGAYAFFVSRKIHFRAEGD